MFLYARLCPPSDLSTPPEFSWRWWYVVMGIAGAVSMAVLMVVYVAKLRRKETRFGCVGSFAPRGWKGGTVLLFQTKVYLFLVPWPSCYMYEGILEQRIAKKKDQNPPTVTFSLCIHSFLHWQGGVWAHDGERRAGGQVPCSSDLQPQNNRSDVWVYCSAPPSCSEQWHFKYLCLVVPAAVGDVPLCMHQPASVWVDSKKGGKRERKRRICSFLWLNKRSGCDQLKGFMTALVGGETLLWGRRCRPGVMLQWGVAVCALSRASIPVGPWEYRQEWRGCERSHRIPISRSWDGFKPWHCPWWTHEICLIPHTQVSACHNHKEAGRRQKCREKAKKKRERNDLKETEGGRCSDKKQLSKKGNACWEKKRDRLMSDGFGWDLHCWCWPGLLDDSQGKTEPLGPAYWMHWLIVGHASMCCYVLVAWAHCCSACGRLIVEQQLEGESAHVVGIVIFRSRCENRANICSEASWPRPNSTMASWPGPFCSRLKSGKCKPWRHLPTAVRSPAGRRTLFIAWLSFGFLRVLFCFKELVFIACLLSSDF